MIKRIIVNNLGKKFMIGSKKEQSALERTIDFISGIESKKEIGALKDVSFSVERGEIFGIIGSNGSGKSTLLRLIAGIYSPDEGSIKINGKIISLINLGIGFQFRLSMKDNIYLCCSLFDLGRDEARKRFASIVKFGELEEFVDTKLYQFSNGMLQRLAFSIAVHCNPEILLLDEIFEFGDESFRIKSVEKMKDLVSKGVSIVIVSHDFNLIERYCDNVIELCEGKVCYEGVSKLEEGDGFKPWKAFSEIIKMKKRNRENFSFINLGAGDGIKNNPFCRYILHDNWRGIFVEPSKEDFRDLRDNFRARPDLIFDNGMNLSFNSLLKKYSLKSVDLFSIDLKRYGVDSLQSIAVSKIKPEILFYDKFLLTEKEKSDAKKALRAAGYRVDEFSRCALAHL